jgi:hypothetical protein
MCLARILWFCFRSSWLCLEGRAKQLAPESGVCLRTNDYIPYLYPVLALTQNWRMNSRRGSAHNCVATAHIRETAGESILSCHCTHVAELRCALSVLMHQFQASSKHGPICHDARKKAAQYYIILRWQPIAQKEMGKKPCGRALGRRRM